MFFEKHMLPLPFKQFVTQDTESRILIFFSVIAVIIQFSIFKGLYPFPNFLPDSYSYIETATNNNNINMWPVGYSKFIRFISVFNYTGMGLFFVQYIFLQFGILFFILTIRFIVNPGKWPVRILTALLVLNPLWLYVSDFVSSDALFAALSLLWLTTLCWILYAPGKDLLIFHGLILFFVFSVRYNALYYPVFSIAVIILAKVDFKVKVVRLAIVCLPLLWFIGYTTWLYKQKYDTVQFSPFGGWQLASNAMYMYSHVAPKSPIKVPASLKGIHGLTLQHMDSLNHVDEKKRPDRELGIYYLWKENAPLRSYLIKYPIGDSSTSYFKRWANLGTLYKNYGSWLIRNYPVEFTRYYLWPNLINYYSPSAEFLSTYNMGDDTIRNEAVEWFKYKTNKVHGFSKDKNIVVTGLFSTFLAIINLIFISSFLGVLFLGGFKHIDRTYRNILILLFSVWITNLLFSVFASPIVLRYQVFPFIFTLTFAVILINRLLNQNKSEVMPKNDVVDKGVPVV
jgi:hypothetical protein